MRMFVLAWLIAWSVPVAVQDDIQAQWHAWQAQREQSLTREESWTSLVGLHWLDGSGPFRLGADSANDIRMDGLPDHLGQLQRSEHGWRLALADGVSVRVDGDSVTGVIDLIGDQNARSQGIAPTRIENGPVRFIMIERGERQALRVWNTQAPARLHFAGLSYFPFDHDWQVSAHWQAHEPARTIEIIDVTGALLPMRNPGAVVFHRDGREYRLEALAEQEDTMLFLIFADRSSGRETYGAGRYLYADLPDEEGRVAVDFNRAYNPPCAYSQFATCPLPPPENRLDLHVSAGELTYRLPVR